ncbi:unnamed protein product [Parnassius apollo]|uniref:(apollo) hypothetical protein n=1 Tax=Parnassius apollo TaxID=110799 RepID=A0A8S3YFC4_PARAO|nr:unnamed protein product [Parnassius apollo]
MATQSDLENLRKDLEQQHTRDNKLEKEGSKDKNSSFVSIETQIRNDRSPVLLRTFGGERPRSILASVAKRSVSSEDVHMRIERPSATTSSSTVTVLGETDDTITNDINTSAPLRSQKEVNLTTTYKDEGFVPVSYKKTNRNRQGRAAVQPLGDSLIRAAPRSLCLYVSRLDVSTTADKLEEYIKCKGEEAISVERIEPFKMTNFASFKMTTAQLYTEILQGLAKNVNGKRLQRDHAHYFCDNAGAHLN